jgi:hypothetical protein
MPKRLSRKRLEEIRARASPHGYLRYAPTLAERSELLTEVDVLTLERDAATELLREFSAREPWAYTEYSEWCVYCDGDSNLDFRPYLGSNTELAIIHEKCCPWLRTRAFLDSVGQEDR